VEALHRWVQANIYYVNEPDEVFQDPLFTLEKRYGDCDDQQILLMAFYESIALPWRFVISGWKTSWFGKRTPYRWIEGTPYNGEPNFDHIYGMVGYPPGRPTEWKFVEPTLPVPTGWDVVGAASKKAPSLGRWFGSSVPGTTATVTTTALAPIGEQGILARLFAKERVLELAAVAATAIVSAIASQIALDAYNRWKAKRK
jgi:transglutaminase-like putative cysteine protease